MEHGMHVHEVSVDLLSSVALRVLLKLEPVTKLSGLIDASDTDQ